MFKISQISTGSWLPPSSVKMQASQAPPVWQAVSSRSSASLRTTSHRKACMLAHSLRPMARSTPGAASGHNGPSDPVRRSRRCEVRFGVAIAGTAQIAFGQRTGVNAISIARSSNRLAVDSPFANGEASHASRAALVQGPILPASLT